MRDEKLAYSLSEAAHKLDGVSIRTVQRLIRRGQLRSVRVLRRVLVPADALHGLVAAHAQPSHNPPRVEPVAWIGAKPCYSNAKDRRSGMSSTPAPAAKELSVLLERLTVKKRKT